MTPYYPQTDRQCNSMIGTLTGILVKTVENNKTTEMSDYHYKGTLHTTGTIIFCGLPKETLTD
jgi:hypothetical protein